MQDQEGTDGPANKVIPTTSREKLVIMKNVAPKYALLDHNHDLHHDEVLDMELENIPPTQGGALYKFLPPMSALLVTNSKPTNCKASAIWWRVL